MSVFTSVFCVGDTSIGGDLDVTGALSLANLDLTDVTDQLTLGTTNTTTISSVAPSASRTYTIPDAGTNCQVVLSAGAQSITGVKTLTTPRILDTTTNTYNLVPSALGGSFDAKLPVLLANDEFTFNSTQQTLALKTLTAPSTTGQVKSANGSDAAPAYTFTSTLGSGMYVVGGDTIGLASGGVGKLLVSSAGVGLNGTSNLACYSRTDVITNVAAATLVLTLLTQCARLFNFTGTGCTVTLPTGAAFNGVIMTFLRTAATGNIVINRAGADFIDNGIATSLTLSAQYQRVTLRYIQASALWIIE
jgi:hypothetical protein